MSNADGSEPDGFRLQRIDANSALLVQAIELADANREFLGIMTPAAWREYAARGGVIVAIANRKPAEACVVGVASFRRGKQRAALAHLAVADEARNCGLARSLVSEVARLTADLSGILVRCRRDFPANEVWPRLGFVPRGEQMGRGKTPKIITWWWFDHGHVDLFAWDGAPGANVPVVLDANVFIDLYGQRTGTEATLTRDALEEAQESGAALMVTPELPRELDRHLEASERRRLIQLVQAAPMVNPPRKAVETARKLIDTEVETTNDRAQDGSDRAHLAYTSAAGVSYLVTRDVRAKRRLKSASSSLGVQLVSPVQLAAELAANDPDPRYWPSVAHGQAFHVVDELSGAVSMLELLNAASLGERRRAVARRLEPLLLAGSNGQAWALSDPTGTPLAGLALTRDKATVVVHLARVTSGHLENVLARYVVQFLSAAAVMEGNCIVRVVDPHMPPAVQASLAAEGFERTNHAYVAPRLKGLMSTADAIHALRELPGAAQDAPKAVQRLQDIDKHGGSSSELLALETSLAPLTLAEPAIPVWSVPIRPIYGYELLGIGESLFPRKDELGISIEHVYYTGAPTTPPAGSRVLWYLSGANAPGYVAQSVVIDSGRLSWKDAFRAHRRLGIYTRDDVQDAAGSSGKIGFLVFGHTRPLPRRVPLNRAAEAASDLGWKMMLRGPWELPPALANDLLEVAFELK